jgi:general secretion pathway protein I
VTLRLGGVPAGCSEAQQIDVMKANRVKSSRGFTLLEVLVALVILSISLGVLFEVFSAGLRGRRTAKEYEQATLLAESKLDAVGIEQPLLEGSSSGQFDNQFQWRVDVLPYHEQGRNEAGDLLWRPLLLTVTVSWVDQKDKRSVVLKTLRLVPRQ